MKCPNCKSFRLKEVSIERERDAFWVGYECRECGYGAVALFEFIEWDEIGIT